MIMRASLLAILLAAALAWTAAEQQRGRLQVVEQQFLDFLVANGRESFTEATPEESSDVVLVDFQEKDKAEYSAWPPAPLDYLMVLKRLVEHEPKVVVVTDPLRWDQAQTEFITQLRTALVPFPTVVMGFHLASEGTGMSEEQTKFAAEEMPVLPGAEGPQQSVPRFSRVAGLSDWALRIVSQAGFSSLGGGRSSTSSIPFVASDGTRLVPSLAAQVVTLFHQMPYAEQRLRFGTGAHLSLGDRFVIPLEGDGTFVLLERPQVPSVNALELMTPDLGDDTSKAVQTMLGKGKVVVLGNGPESVLHARAIASALAMPHITRGSAGAIWAFAGAACLFGFWQLRFRRMKALLTGAAALMAGFMICLLVFQSALVWWPPFMALVAVAVSTVFCFIWPAKVPVVPVVEKTAETQAQPEAKES